MPLDAAAVRAIALVAFENPFLAQGAQDERDVGAHADRHVQEPGIRHEEGSVRHDVAGINRVPHEEVGALGHHAAVRRHDAEAAAERQLTGNHQTQAGARNRRRDLIGHQPGVVGPQQKRTGDRYQRHRAGGQRPIDDVSTPPHDGENDDKRFADEQQESGNPVGLEKVREEILREKHEQNPNRHPGGQVGQPIARHGQWTSSRSDSSDGGGNGVIGSSSMKYARQASSSKSRVMTGSCPR